MADKVKQELSKQIKRELIRYAKLRSRIRHNERGLRQVDINEKLASLNSEVSNQILAKAAPPNPQGSRGRIRNSP